MEELIQPKYLHSKSLWQVKAKSSDSPFWKGIMRVKDDFFELGFFTIGDGENTRFWKRYMVR
jgi:hypothetical protein